MAIVSNNTVELRKLLRRVNALQEMPKNFDYIDIDLSTKIVDPDNTIQFVFPFEVVQNEIVTIEVSWSSTYQHNARFWLAYEWWEAMSDLCSNVLINTSTLDNPVQTAKVIFTPHAGNSNQILFKLALGDAGVLEDVLTIHSLRVCTGADPDAVNYSQFKPQSISVETCNLTVNASTPCQLYFNTVKDSGIDISTANLTADTNYSYNGIACGSSLLSIHLPNDAIDGTNTLFDTISVSSGELLNIYTEQINQTTVGAIIRLPQRGDCIINITIPLEVEDNV